MSKKYKNNCLFDAILLSIANKEDDEISYKLRYTCNKILKSEGWEYPKYGKVAGDIYLPVISKLLNRKIEVIQGDNRYYVMDGEKQNNDFNPVLIFHVGEKDYGHWIGSKNSMKDEYEHCDLFDSFLYLKNGTRNKEESYSLKEKVFSFSLDESKEKEKIIFNTLAELYDTQIETLKYGVVENYGNFEKEKICLFYKENFKNKGYWWHTI